MGVRLGVWVFGFDGGGEREDHVLGAVERVVGAFQAQRGAHSRHQLHSVDRLRHVVVRSHLERAHAIRRPVERRDHHDRHQLGRGIRLDPLAHFIAVHARHLDVEQDQVGGRRAYELERANPVFSRSHLAFDSGEARLDELAVGGPVVDHQHDGCVIGPGQLSRDRDDRD